MNWNIVGDAKSIGRAVTGKIHLIYPGFTGSNGFNSRQPPIREGQENNFNSLPWEEISLARRIGGVPVLPPEHEIQDVRDRHNKSREQSSRIFGWPGSSNRNHHHQHSPAGSNELSGGGGNVKQSGHWLLRERSTTDSPSGMGMLQSMPPDINLGLVGSQSRMDRNGSPDVMSTKTGSSSGGGAKLNRNEPNRSSFGMALKDKFNQNPNMYFPGRFALMLILDQLRTDTCYF